MKNRFLLICIMIAVLIVSLVPLSVYGYDYRTFVIKSKAYSAGDTNSTEESEYSYIWFGDYAKPYGNLYLNSTNVSGDKTVYGFLYGDSASGYYICVAVEGALISGESYPVRFAYDSTSGGGVSLSTSNDTYNALTNLSYATYTSRKIYGAPYFPSYSTLDDGLNALKTAIDNGTVGGITPKSASITIQPGYIAYIGVSGGSAHLEITFPYKFSSATLSTQSYWFTNSLPSGSFTINPSNEDSTPIIWEAAGPFDAVSRTYNGEFNISDVGTGYLVIYNPLLSLGFENSNDAIRVNITNTVSVTQYPLTSSGSYTNQESYGNEDNVYVADNDAINNDGTIDYTHYDVDSNGNTITGSAINLPAGGNNIIDNDNDSTISNFISQILNLLSAPIKHIQTLFESGSAFMQWLGNLWGWLPEPVYAVLISALVVLIVIGVIKFLWK